MSRQTIVLMSAIGILFQLLVVLSSYIGFYMTADKRISNAERNIAEIARVWNESVRKAQVSE